MPTQDELLLGQIVVASGRVSPDELARCIAEQAAQEPPPPLAAILLGKGYLRPCDLDDLLETHPSLVLTAGGDGAPLRVADLERQLGGSAGSGARGGAATGAGVPAAATGPEMAMGIGPASESKSGRGRIDPLRILGRAAVAFLAVGVVAGTGLLNEDLREQVGRWLQGPIGPGAVAASGTGTGVSGPAGARKEARGGGAAPAGV
ncbi:MAG: hypothetical protein HZA54_03475, partial [Planctomycetes bacterium]|nr:hypothetical protein [Planctomycetota bacterium]